MIGDCANCNCAHVCATKGISCKPVNKDEVLHLYSEEEKRIMQAAAYVEATYYMQYTRLQETAAFAKKMGYKKIGLAFCIGISEEIELIAKYLSKFFTVYSICCKNCGIVKDTLGLPKVQPDSKTESMCNPKNQAHFLNEAGCELFVSAGLCVGHDALFNKACKGPVTNLIAKDRVLAHNPIGVVYSKYWRNKLGI